MAELKYMGFWNTVNPKPSGDYVLIWASDWNKDYWGFYAYIGVETYREDIEAINNLIHRLNRRDGDVYVELIDHSPNLRDFYKKLYDLGYFTHWDTLDPEKWEEFKHLLP